VGVCCFPCVLPLAEGLTYVVPSFASVQTDLAIEASVIRVRRTGLSSQRWITAAFASCLLWPRAGCLPLVRGWYVVGSFVSA